MDTFGLKETELHFQMVYGQQSPFKMNVLNVTFRVLLSFKIRYIYKRGQVLKKII